MKNSSYIIHVCSLLIFGMNGVVASYIELSSIQIVLLRTFLGSALLFFLFLLSGGKFTFYKHKKELFYLIISGIAMGTSWIFLYEAFARVGVGIATLLYSCGPVIVMALSPFMFKEKLTIWKITGFIAVLCGVVFINGNLATGDGDLIGVVCGLLSAFMYSFMVTFNKKAAKISGFENSSLQILIAFLTVTVCSVANNSIKFEIVSDDIFPILLLGVVNTGIACYMYFSSIGKLPVQSVAICGYLEPLSAVIFSFIFLSEKLQPMQIIGAVLIIGGAMFAELFTGLKNSKDEVVIINKKG